VDMDISMDIHGKSGYEYGYGWEISCTASLARAGRIFRPPLA